MKSLYTAVLNFSIEWIICAIKNSSWRIIRHGWIGSATWHFIFCSWKYSTSSKFSVIFKILLNFFEWHAFLPISMIFVNLLIKKKSLYFLCKALEKAFSLKQGQCRNVVDPWTTGLEMQRSTYTRILSFFPFFSLLSFFP